MEDIVQLPISIGALTKAIDGIMKNRGYVPADSLVGRTIKMPEFSKKYCGNKADKWIRLFIFDQYPEVDFQNGGWVVNPHWTDKGRRTIIFENPASEWMEKHRTEIDWNAKLPK